ncbi:MAG: sulfur carrier protein ThiS [Acidobacteriota bacterium]
MSATITIQTDRGPLDLPAPCTLAQALDTILGPSGPCAERVATAVNGQFVSRTDRVAHWLAHGDTVLCFAPITGG